jgi:carboxylesterase
MNKIIILFLIFLLILITGCGERSFYIDTKIKQGNEPFLLEAKSNKSCLLIHGFGASPWEMKKLGEFLYSHNITVYGVLLKGHGTSIRDFETTTWKDWYNDVEKGYKLLRNKTNMVYICGFSAGAALGNLIAEKENVSGIISVSAPIYLKDPRAKFAFVLRYFIKYEDINLSVSEKNHYYNKRPTDSVLELFKLIDVYKKDLGKITEPILIIQSEDDELIDKKSADYIYNNVNSNIKDIKFMKNKPHLIIRDDEVLEMVLDFIKNN